MTIALRTRRSTLVLIWFACRWFARADSSRPGELAMKVNVILPPVLRTAFASVAGVNLLIAPDISAQTIAPRPAQVTTGVTAEVERVIVTGSNIPTAEETGPNPVDT